MADAAEEDSDDEDLRERLACDWEAHPADGQWRWCWASIVEQTYLHCCRVF